MQRRDQQRLAEMIVWALQHKQVRLFLLACAILALGVWLVMGRPGCEPAPQPPPSGETTPEPSPDELPETPPVQPAGPGSYLFCFWNVENLFDDVDNHRTAKGDKEYDAYFSHNAVARNEKLKH